MRFPAGRSVAHVVVSRSSTGSSARFVSCYAAAFMGMQRASGMMRASMGASVGSMTNMMSMTGTHAASMPRNLTMGQAISGGAELDLSLCPGTHEANPRMQYREQWADPCRHDQARVDYTARVAGADWAHAAVCCAGPQWSHT